METKFTFRIDTSVLRKLEQVATVQDRSVGYLIRKAVAEYLKKEAK